jgi:nicotinamidase-related amidase
VPAGRGYGELPAHPYGILKGVVDSTAFVKGEWGAEIVDVLSPQEGDVVVEGKRGLDTFATTNLDFILRAGDHDNRARRVPHQLLRRVDHAHRLREGLRGDHAV